jgi:hypothetical protein
MAELLEIVTDVAMDFDVTRELCVTASQDTDVVHEFELYQHACDVFDGNISSISSIGFILEHRQCPSCSGVKPCFTTSCGHLVCYDCMPRLTGGCPACSRRKWKASSHGVERHVEAANNRLMQAIVVSFSKSSSKTADGMC